MLKNITAAILLLPSFNAYAVDRWFNQDVVNVGARLFQQHCAVCHGANAESTPDWKKSDAQGNYPAPPLDGKGHAWHHPIPQLVKSIKDGSIQLGGTMPGFADKLSDQDVLALIGYFQSKWPDQTYQAWHNRFMQ